MADNFGIYELTGHLEITASSTLDMSPGSVNELRKAQRDLRDDAEITAQNESFSKLKNSFVVPELSSSHHEVTSCNAFLSGTEYLEGIQSGSTMIKNVHGATGQSYYTKSQQLVKLVYKLSASALLPDIPGTQRQPSTIENVARGTYDAVSGSYRNNSYFAPAEFDIDIPDHGKIRDIKVWVEFVHDHRGGTGTSSADFGNPHWCGGAGNSSRDLRTGLQGVQVALRSPNTNFKYSHPLWNEQTVAKLDKGPNVANQNVKKVPDLLQNSYLLWAGHTVESDLGTTLGPSTSSLPDNANIYQRVLSSVTGGILYTDLQISRSGKLYGCCTQMHLETATGLSYRSVTLVTSSLRILTGSTYTYEDGAMWRKQRLTPGRLANVSSGSYVNLCVDNNDKVHTTYTTHAGTIVYTRVTASLDKDTHTLQVITNMVSPDGSAAGTQPRISLDNDNNPYIVYSVEGNRACVARSSSLVTSPTSWDVENVPVSVINGLSFTRIIFSEDNSLNIFYKSPTRTAVLENKIMHAVSSSANGWSSVPTISAPFLVKDRFSSVGTSSYATEFYTPEVVKDVYGNLHCLVFVTLYDSIPANNSGYKYYGVAYAKSGSTGWDGEIVYKSLKTGTPYITKYPNSNIFCRLLTVDNTGSPHILIPRFILEGVDVLYAYPTDLIYMRSSSLGWSSQFIATTTLSTSAVQYPSNAQDASIAIDSFNKPHIFYAGLKEPFIPTYTADLGMTGTLEYVSIDKLRVSGSSYFSYDTDIDMRTIFDDSSKVTNPRHIDKLYDNVNFSSLGNSLFPTTLLKTGNYPSPTSASLSIFDSGTSSSFYWHNINEGGFPVDQVHFMTGSNFPWMLDSRIPPGNFVGREYSATASLSHIDVPSGWLSGIGKTPSVNEFHTSGAQLGPATIKPVYPLLDDVFVEKLYDEPLDPLVGSSPYHLSADRHKLVGFRPGLRGTEIHGRWKLLIGNTWDVNSAEPTTSYATGSLRGGIWFRQFRLEFIVDQGGELRFGTNISQERRYKKHSYVPSGYSKRIINILSGSSAWDIGVNYVYTTQGEEYGRSIGITSATSSAQFAVFSQMTGVLPDILSGSGLYNQVQSTYLSNEFGTPYIPLSAGSAQTPSFDTFDIEEVKKTRILLDEVLNPKTLIAEDNTLRATVSRADVILSTRDSILRKLNDT